MGLLDVIIELYFFSLVNLSCVGFICACVKFLTFFKKNSNEMEERTDNASFLVKLDQSSPSNSENEVRKRV